MIIIPALVDKVSTLKDGTLKITFETQELEAEMMSEVFSYANKLVYIGINGSQKFDIDKLNVKEMPVEFSGQKSQSQRLRSVLYVYWEKNKPTKDFETFYKRKTDEFIELVKDKID